jgi:5-methylcytosine-specific restriction endonuclease McrA
LPTLDPRLDTQAYKRVRRYVLLRDRFACQIRGPKCKGYATCVDHVISRADGGDVLDPANMRAACVPCNGGRAADRTNAMRRAARYRTGLPTYDVRL